MKDLPLDKLNAVAEVFVVVPLMANAIWEAVVANDAIPGEVSEQIAEDSAIIMHRMNAMLEILDEQYPGFRTQVQIADQAAQRRAAQMADEAAVSVKH